MNVIAQKGKQIVKLFIFGFEKFLHWGHLEHELLPTVAKKRERKNELLKNRTIFLTRHFWANIKRKSGIVSFLFSPKIRYVRKVL